jgi:intein/homing endonuclease
MPCSNINTIIEHNPFKDRTLIKIVDVLGREIKAIRNTPLFLIYDDGTVEKRIIIE